MFDFSITPFPIIHNRTTFEVFTLPGMSRDMDIKVSFPNGRQTAEVWGGGIELDRAWVPYADAFEIEFSTGNDKNSIPPAGMYRFEITWPKCPIFGPPFQRYVNPRDHV